MALSKKMSQPEVEAGFLHANIRNLAYGGEGVGEVTAAKNNALLGITAFVPYTIPGETVTAKIIKEKDRYVKTELVELLNPSPDRVSAECKYFQNCGGCELQHISYPKQLELKSEMIRGAFAAAKYRSTELELIRPVAPSRPFGYRRRITLHIAPTGGGKIGFYQSGSRSVVEISKCEVAEASINQLFPKIQELSRAIAGRISSLVLESDDKGVIAVLKSPYDIGAREQERILKIAHQYLSDVVLMAAGKEIGGFGRKIIEFPLNQSGTMMLQAPAGYFSQINREINLSLISYVTAFAKSEQTKTALDLYAGAGNFSIPLAKSGIRVKAVEVDKQLVNIGQQNSLRYVSDKQLSFTASPVERFLTENNAEFDLIVADPPRSGLAELTRQLPHSQSFVLVSCHLPSCVRDVKMLLDAGYQLLEIQPFDMFAQTTYVEIACLFSRLS